MKSFFLTLLIFAAGAAHAPAQTPRAQQQPPQPASGASEHLYRLGDHDVSIPPPEGFVEAASRSEELKKFFEATEAKELDTLAVHLPAEVMEKVARGEHPFLEFYTKVSVSKQLRSMDQSQADFSGIVSYLRANNAKLFNLKSPEMQSQLKQQNKNLTELLKSDAKFDLSQPVSLGEIESTENSYGVLMLMKLKLNVGDEQLEKMIIGGTSAVRVKNRLVWIYTYRVFNSEKDSDVLRDFTKRWLADILRANAQ